MTHACGKGKIVRNIICAFVLCLLSHIETTWGQSPVQDNAPASVSVPRGGEEVGQGSPQSRLRLDLLRVSLLAETGRLDEAFVLIGQLKESYPDHPEVLAAEADLNLRTGNRGAGLALLSRATAMDPDNEDILERRKAAVMPLASFTSAGIDVRSSGQATEHFTRAAHQAQLTPTMSASLAVENNHMKSRGAFSRLNGRSERFDGDRQRAMLTLFKLFESGNEATGALYLANQVIGAGASYGWRDRWGGTTVQADLQRPEWDYIEAVADHGAKDRLRLARTQHLSARTEGSGGVGVNRYTLDGDEMARSLAVDVALNYAFSYAPGGTPDGEWQLGARYSADAEYFSRVERRTAVNGTVFKPLPVASYEVHAVTVSAAKQLLPRLQLEGYGGYGVDRLGGDGPLLGAVFTYKTAENFGVELRASRGLISERSSEKVDQLGLALKYYW